MTAKIVNTTNMKKELAKAHLIVKEGPFSSLFSDFFGFITSASHNLFRVQFGYSFPPRERQFCCEDNEYIRPLRLFQLLFSKTSRANTTFTFSIKVSSNSYSLFVSSITSFPRRTTRFSFSIVKSR